MFAPETRPWIWVPDQVTVRRVERALGVATWDNEAAVIVVAPTPLAYMDRLNAPSGTLAWHTLYLALDLAQDRATKHASDLLDVYRLVDRCRPSGLLVPELQRAPGHLIEVIASIVRAEYLANPAKKAATSKARPGESEPMPPYQRESLPRERHHTATAAVTASRFVGLVNTQDVATGITKMQSPATWIVEAAGYDRATFEGECGVDTVEIVGLEQQRWSGRVLITV